MFQYGFPAIRWLVRGDVFHSCGGNLDGGFVPFPGRPADSWFKPGKPGVSQNHPVSSYVDQVESLWYLLDLLSVRVSQHIRILPQYNCWTYRHFVLVVAALVFVCQF